MEFVTIAKSRALLSTIYLLLLLLPPSRYPKLSDDIDADVCVVGGGVSGLTTAYLLAKAGMIHNAAIDGSID